MNKNKIDWKTILWIFSLSRIIIFILTVISIFHIPSDNYSLSLQFPGLIPPYDCFDHMDKCLLSWWRWDVRNYVEIAYKGYDQLPLTYTAFFPFWPLCISLLGKLFGGSPISMYFASILLANLCFLAALTLFYCLVSEEFSPTIARYAAFFLAFNPYGLFFFAGYTESLFLLLSIAVFYFLRRGHPLDWWLAGLCAGIAMLTRATSIALSIPFLIVIIERFWHHRASLHLQWRSLLNTTLPLLLIPIGLSIYISYLWLVKGDPLAFQTAEIAGWGRHLSFPWIGFFRSIQGLFFVDVPSFSFTSNSIDLIFTLIPLITIILGWQYLPWHYRLFAITAFLVALCFPYSPKSPLLSTPRYMMAIFPQYILLAIWSKHQYARYLMLLLFITFFLFNIVLFATGRWVA